MASNNNDMLDGRLDVPALFDSGAALSVEQLAVTLRKLQLHLAVRPADDSSATILVEVRVRLKLRSFMCVAACCGKDLN